MSSFGFTVTQKKKKKKKLSNSPKLEGFIKLEQKQLKLLYPSTSPYIKMNLLH